MYLQCESRTSPRNTSGISILFVQAPKLAPVREFMTALINIGKKLPHVPTKEKKSKARRCRSGSRMASASVLAQNLIGEMKRMNMNLPARVWIPFYKFPHHVVRIAYTESTVLNSRDRVRILFATLKLRSATTFAFVGTVHCLHRSRSL